VIELTGGNDGLNTVIPHADDLYHKARPTLRFKKEEVVKVSDAIGLHPALRPLDSLLQKSQLAIVQGVGYPNPDRSHFESMDIWQTADPKRRIASGWLGRTLDDVKVSEGRIAAMSVGRQQLPLVLQGSAVGVPTVQRGKAYDLEISVDGSNFQSLDLNVPKPTPEPPT